MIGDQQPEWTAHRRFPTTHVYVLPPWQVEFEQWWKGKFPREGKSEHLYAEWKFNDGAPDAYELKLLFGEQLGRRWHWAFNVFYEKETGGLRATEMGFSQALSYSPPNSKLSVGMEMNFEHTTEHGSRSDPSIEFLIGPSFQWRPTFRTHPDLVPLFGTTPNSPRVEVFVVFGFELGKSAGNKEISAPVSARAIVEIADQTADDKLVKDDACLSQVADASAGRRAVELPG